MENNIGKDFIRLTKYENLEPSAHSLGVEKPALELPLPEGTELISLPDGKSLRMDNLDFKTLLEKRQTLRNYSSQSLTQEELAFLLWGTQGVKTTNAKSLTKRTVPSAGSRHPFETYLLINRVEDLQSGLYRYMAMSHQLAKLPAEDNVSQQLTEACLKQKQILNSAVTFAWVADVHRTVWHYCQRGYRYMYLDAGHVCQNLYLLAEAIGCGACAIAAFTDDMVNSVLGLDGENQFAIYLAALGKRETP